MSIYSEIIIDPSTLMLPGDVNWKYSLALWAELSGIKVDGRDFSFIGHEYMLPLYMDTHPKIVLMKAAQMGATIWMVLRAFHQALFPKGWGFSIPIKVGFYFPGNDGLKMLVKGRVEPIMANAPDLQKYTKAKSQTLKPIEQCAVYFFYIGGKSAKDSTPLMSAFFDEARLMDPDDIEQAMERVSHSPIEYLQVVSTAGIPYGDIHHFFLNSDQKWFTTVCEHCGYEQVLCLDFPDCIAEHTMGPRMGDVYYICKKCRQEISRPQNGHYVAHGDPKHEVSGYQVSQIMRRTAKELITKFREMTNRREFYNSKLGIPFVDEDNKPVSIDILDNNVNTLIEWGQSLGGGNFMGVDQMSGQNYVMIVSKGLLTSQRRLIWFEIIDDRDPFERTSELMEKFDVEVCVCDAEPNKNDALRFAKRFGNKVFLAKYGKYLDMVSWKDNWKPKREHRKAEPDTFHQYRVFIDKYHSLERTLLMIRDGQVEWADPEKLLQKAYPYSGGRKEVMPIMRTHAYDMFASAVREQKTLNKKLMTNEHTWYWCFPGIDPHALCAIDYALRASERRSVQPFIFTM